MFDKMMRKLRQGGNEITTEDQSNLTNEQRIQALANISDQTANANTGKMGYKVLLPGKSFAEQVTEANTIYEIRDVFDLNETTISTPILLPEGCTLKFNGGMLKNCTLVGQNSTIEADGKIFDNVSVTGSWACVGKIAWWAIGSKFNTSTNLPIDNDETTAIQLALDSSFKELVFDPVPYCITSTLILRNAKNLRLSGVPNTTIASSGNTKKANATYIYTRSNIDVLNVSVYISDPLQKIVIEGGAFDASLCSTFTGNLIHVSTGNGQKVWGMEINTTLFGKNNGVGTIPGGYGIMIGDTTGTSAAGYATMIRINSHFQYLNTAVYILSNSSTGGWVTDVVVDGECSSCAKAVYTNAGNTDVRLSIQTAAFFDIDTKDTNAAITFDGTRSSQLAFSVSSWVWDLGANPSGTTRYSNAKSLEILGNARVEIYGSFAVQAALQGNSFINKIIGSVNNIYGRVGNLPRSIQFPYKLQNFVPNALNDILLGCDLTGHVTTTAKLMRYNNGEYSEDANLETPNTVANLYRDNSDIYYLRVGSGPSMGEKDYFQLDLEFDSNSYHRIASFFLFFRKYSATETINNQPNKVEAYINPDNENYKMYASSPVNYSTEGFFGDYIEFSTDLYSTTTKKIAIKIFAPNASQVNLYRLSAFAFFNNTSSNVYNLHNPYISRCGGDIYGPLNIYGTVNFGDNANVGFLPFGKSVVISNNLTSFVSNINLLPNITKARALRFTPPTTSGRFQYSYLVAIGGSKNKATYYAWSGLYMIMFMGDATGTDNTNVKFIVRKIYSNFNASFDLYYKASTNNVIFDVKVVNNDSITNTFVSVLNPDKYLSVANDKQSGSTQRPSSDSNYILIDVKGDTASRPNQNYIETGFQYFDTDLGKVIVNNGSTWVNPDGSPLETHTITNTLASVTNSNPATEIDGNKTYMVTLTPGMDYVIQSVTVTMGGTDVTSFVYNPTTHVIYIASVTGDIVITATAGTPN